MSFSIRSQMPHFRYRERCGEEPKIESPGTSDTRSYRDGEHARNRNPLNVKGYSLRNIHFTHIY